MRLSETGNVTKWLAGKGKIEKIAKKRGWGNRLKVSKTGREDFKDNGGWQLNVNSRQLMILIIIGDPRDPQQRLLIAHTHKYIEYYIH